MADVTLISAFIAGIISFISPCVLPLVPPYLAYLAGVSVEEFSSDERPRPVMLRIFATALSFVLGFTTLFVALGASATSIGLVLRQYATELGIVAGIIIVIMGLHFLGVIRIGLLYREARVDVQRKPPGTLGAYIMGLAFAVGWTPCIGPVLTVILAMAGTKETVAEGALMLAIYSLGLGVPFLIAAAFAPAFMRFMKRFRQHMHRVEQVMGGFLVVTGVMFMTGYITVIAYWLAELFPGLAEIG